MIGYATLFHVKNNGVFDNAYTGDGLKIEEIIAKGPLTLAGSQIKKGCIIEKIDGTPIKKDADYYPLLSGKVGKKVMLSVYDPTSKQRFEEQVKAIGNGEQSNLLYKRWIENCQETVDKLSNGQIGYVHVRGMNSESFRDTIEEGLDAIRDVIYYIETYDVTTVRASTPMYLLARVIKSMGIKMVLSGEGADEVFGGYLYFHKAPDAKAFHEETVRKLSKLYMYDCLRANKSLCAWGVEGRVPFLDKEFLDIAMRLNPEAKMCPGSVIEKKILREAFADVLPSEIAWRQKEQFSDGVGYSWIDTLKKVTAQAVSDTEMANAARRFPINTPQNKEEYFYRTIFEEHFPSESAARSVPSVPSVACSTAEALAWDTAFKNMNDPSGRAVKGVHEAAY